MMTAASTRHLLSWDNGATPQPRITLDDAGNVTCPADQPHAPHTDAVWFDWQTCEVWTCSGLAFTPLDPTKD